MIEKIKYFSLASFIILILLGMLIDGKFMVELREPYKSMINLLSTVLLQLLIFCFCFLLIIQIVNG